jgi:hypothetical protein
VTSDKITFQCSCGQAMAAKAEHAGMKARCPACSTIVSIPGGAGIQDKVATRPSAGRPAARPPAEEFDEFDDEDDRPRRKRRKKSALPWILGGVGALLLLVGGGIGAYFLWFRGGSLDEAALIPGDAQVVAVWRAADTLNTDIGKNFLAELKKGPGPDPLADFEGKIGMGLADVERLTVVAIDPDKQLIWAVLTAKKTIDKAKLLALSSTPATSNDHAGKKYDIITTTGGQWQRLGLYSLSDKVLVFGPELGLQRALDVLGGKKPSGAMDGAIKRAGEKHSFFLAVVPPPEVVQMGRAQAANPQMAAFTPLLDTKVVSVLLDLGSTIKLEVGLSFPDATKAKAAKDALDSLKALVKTMLPLLGGQLKAMPGGQGDQAMKEITQALDKLKIEQSGADVTVTLTADGKDLVNHMAEFVAGLKMGMAGGGGGFGPGQGPLPPNRGGRLPPNPPPKPPGGGGGGKRGGPPPPAEPEAPGVGVNPNGNPLGNLAAAPLRVQHTNNLKQLALAFHIYMDMNKQMPSAAVFSQDGKPLLSWRVAILPFIEEERLYKEFHLDEPWDSPHNKALLPRMPKVYRLPGTKERSKTHYQLFVGPNTPWPGDGRTGPKVATFADGMSNTLLIAESMSGVDWTKPEDMQVDPQRSPRLLLGHRLKADTCYAALADGSVRSFSVAKIREETLRHLIDPMDGNVIEPDTFEQ